MLSAAQQKTERPASLAGITQRCSVPCCLPTQRACVDRTRGTCKKPPRRSWSPHFNDQRAVCEQDRHSQTFEFLIFDGSHLSHELIYIASQEGRWLSASGPGLVLWALRICQLQKQIQDRLEESTREPLVTVCTSQLSASVLSRRPSPSARTLPSAAKTKKRSSSRHV